jgi:RNA polymerase sigma-70 factor, ECF subfamily
MVAGTTGPSSRVNEVNTMANEPDSGLLGRFVQGDREAFEALFRQFEAEVFRWIFWIVRDQGTAEDAVVETFWRAYRGRARFDPSRSFGAWMRRIATNTARDHLRAARRSEAWMREGAVALERVEPDRRLRDAIAEAFRALPPRLHVVAMLALVEGRPYAEIAEAVGVPVGTVKSRAFRAIRALRAELGKAGIRP